VETVVIISLIIFTITYAGIIFTRLPWVNIDRPSAAFFGAVSMIIFGVLSFEESVRAIDFNTIALLLGMMIVIATLEIDGFFSFIASKTISYSKTRRRFLVIVVFVTGISSAFLVNDAVVLLFTPVIISICRASKLDPVPYCIAEILSSNAGSAMTITGNPQNMIIGINSGIPYGRFLLMLLPVSFISMLIILLVVMVVYAGHFRSDEKLAVRDGMFQYSFESMNRSVPIFCCIILMFFLSDALNLSIPVIALAGGSLVLMFGRIGPSRIIREVDWVLLLFFASLFIVVHGIEKTGIIQSLLMTDIIPGGLPGIATIHGLSFFLSQIVSNVPYTIVMLPIMRGTTGESLWLSLASASTLAGNATIIGAMANLIVIESAKNLDVRIGFMEFLKTGILVTLTTLALSAAVLYAELSMGLIR
jgi:Na+/H+ antiporter NhaD/arsenite permease-like protein